jgi:PhzF family phenazine biosynthesis protein
LKTIKIPIYQVDAFTNQPLQGNPAAVCPLDDWLPTDTMQAIAQENNLSETAFFVPLTPECFHLRWFTPEHEIDLCGHATLAAAFTLFNCLHYHNDSITFTTASGNLGVKKCGSYLQLDLPQRLAKFCEILPGLASSLNLPIVETLQYNDKYVVITDDVQALRELTPDFELLGKYAFNSLLISTRDTKFDCVSRYFNPKKSIKEDPVTGSAHCILAPYWAKQLNKNKLHAYQASARGGELFCEVTQERVLISGEAALYLQGEIYW